MKPFIQKIMMVLAMMCFSISSFAYDFEVDGLYYNINSDKTSVTLTKASSSAHYTGRLIIPETVTYNQKSYTVTDVASSTFQSSPALISVDIPNSVTTLPAWAFFQCTAISEVLLGDGIVTVPQNCFRGCTALRSIIIPGSVETIDESAFQGCSSIAEITIPSNVTRIEDSAFVGCKALSHITFSDSPNLLKIGYGYYEGTYKGSFDECPLFDVYIGRNISNLYTSNVNNMDDVFQGHKTLSEITFGENVTKIYKESFQNCTALSSINVLGTQLKEIQDYAFQGCSKLAKISGNALNFVQIIGLSAFSDCPLIKEVVLPSITSIGKSAFYSYKGSLEKVFLGDNITVIPERCFYSQSSLKHAYLGSSISSIETNAFGGCSGIINIYLFSENLVSLGDNAIPNTISKIFVPSPSRYDNILKDYYRDYLVILNHPSNIYSGSAPTFNYVNNVVDTNIEFLMTSLSVNVGDYNTPVSIKFIYGNWSSVVSINSSYTITPAPLTIIANDVSRVYGMENPELTCSFFGFKNGETKDVLTRLPNVETTATMSSNVGTYPIIPTGAEAQNYTLNYERGTLTITKADQTIEWDQQLGTANVGDVIELTATSSAGLPIKYTSTDETIAEIFSQGGKKFVEFLKPGNVSIRAAQEGNENYNEADRVSKSVKVDMLVSGITLNQNTATIVEGNSIQLIATVLPDNASNKALMWESLNPGIATVDQNGYVTGISVGNTKIIVSATDDSGVSAECAVTVSEYGGIDDIIADKSVYVKIFNLHGVLVYEGVYSDAKLLPDYYIVVCDGKSAKVKVK